MLIWLVWVLFCICPVAWCATCNGEEPLQPLHLTISEPIQGSIAETILAGYPPEVYDMTPTEFFKWATDQNDKARAEWDKWYETAPSHWITYDEATSDGWHDGIQLGYRGSNGYGERHSTQRHYQRRYLNPDYTGRSLTIINPFCQPTKQ
jgi:hypothetical protein